MPALSFSLWMCISSTIPHTVQDGNPCENIFQWKKILTHRIQQRYGLAVVCSRVRGTDFGSACKELLKEVAIIFIASTIVWSQVNNWEGIHLQPSTENWIKDLLSMTPPIRTRFSFPLSQSHPSGSFHKPLTLIHQRADRMKTTLTES